MAPATHLPSVARGALLLALLLAPAVHAMDAVVLEVRELTVGGITVRDAGARLDLLADDQTRVTLRAREATLPDPVGKLTALQLVCATPVIADPRFGCEHGKLTARGGPTGSLDMEVRAQTHTDTGVTTFGGQGLRLADTQASFDGRLDGQGWQVKGRTGEASIAALRKLAAPWYALPEDISGDGKVVIDALLADEGRGLQADVTARLAAVDLTNEASTIVTDKMVAVARLKSEPRGADTSLAMSFEGTAGQVLVNPVLLDFGVNPTRLDAQAILHGDTLTFDSLQLVQKDLLDLAGRGSLDLAAPTPSFSGTLEIGRLQFPSAFTSYVQIALATSILGDATTAGSLSGELAIENNVVSRLHVVPKDMEVHAHMGRLNISKMNGDVYWAPVGTEARISHVSWASGGAYGLSGGATEFDFVAYGLNFALAHRTKLPVFDGAIDIENFVLANLGAPDMEVAFKGSVEPISMPLLAKAFGWPEFSGTLAATVPAVRLKNDVLTFDGNVESDVFGGHIVGSNIRLQDPLGNYPRFFADVRARDLDLSQVTQTFEIGSITGKLEVDMLGLELFNWSPIAFDARLATPKGDKSRHRISAKAVSTLANAGGGGGSVMQALQSGVLRFFDEYNYEKLGIHCRLRGDVCEMEGIEPTTNGYYIVKGSGIPRIDIVGSQARVNYRQLLSTISETNFSGATTQ